MLAIIEEIADMVETYQRRHYGTVLCDDGTDRKSYELEQLTLRELIAVRIREKYRDYKIQLEDLEEESLKIITENLEEQIRVSLKHEIQAEILPELEAKVKDAIRKQLKEKIDKW